MIRSADKLRPKENCANRESWFRLGFNLLQQTPFSFKSNSFVFFFLYEKRNHSEFLLLLAQTSIVSNVSACFFYFRLLVLYLRTAWMPFTPFIIIFIHIFGTKTSMVWPRIRSQIIIGIAGPLEQMFIFLYVYLNAVLPLSWHGCNSLIILRLWLVP